MNSLLTTDLAAVSDESKLYLYYQGAEDKKIHEISSCPNNSVEWTESSTIVGDSCCLNGSPITAYHVKHDSNFDGNPTIHVVYIDSNKSLREKVKVISKGDSWEEISVPAQIKNSPDKTSKLASGTCHNNSSGANQWVYFVRENAQTGVSEVVELQKDHAKGSTWVLRKTLPETPASALVGTSLAVSMTDITAHLFFQDHDSNILEYDGSYEIWGVPKQIEPKSKVNISTPLATSNPSNSEKPFCFFVGGANSQICIGDEQLGSSIPGSRLGAAVLNNHTYIFYKAITSVASFSVIVYDKPGTWKPETVVFKE